MTNLFDWFRGNSALTFAHPWLLLLLLAVPLLAYLRGKRGPAAALTFSSTASLRAIGKQSAARAGKILRSLLLAAIAVFVIALARPQLGKSLTQIEASGIDIILALDVSGSMLTKDFTIGGQEATRVDAIREVTRKFIEGRPNDRIGIIAFAGRPYVVSPMTLDHDWLLQNLDRELDAIEPVRLDVVGKHAARGIHGNQQIETLAFYVFERVTPARLRQTDKGQSKTQQLQSKS